MRYTAQLIKGALESYQELQAYIDAEGSAAQYEYWVLYDAHLETAVVPQGRGREPSVYELVRLRADLDMAIDQLPRHLYRPAHLVWRQGMTYRQAARHLRLGTGTIANRLREARNLIVQKLLNARRQNDALYIMGGGENATLVH